MRKVSFPKLSGATPNPKPLIAAATLEAQTAAVGTAKSLHEDNAAKFFSGLGIAGAYGVGVAATLAERGSRYGDFTHHAEVAQRLQDVMREYPGWDQCNPVQRQALTVIADKIARILSGDPNYADNWHDIQGYAKLVEDRLPKE